MQQAPKSSGTSQPLLAKPSGVTYRQHISNVKQEGREWINIHPAAVKKYRRLFDQDLSALIDLICADHDLGKQMTPWQVACKKDHVEFLKWLKQNPSGKFEEFEREKPGIAGKYIREAGMRHEFYSPLLVTHRKLSVPELVSIVAHHGKLSEKHRHRWEAQQQPELLRKTKQASKIIESRSIIVNEYDCIVLQAKEAEDGLATLALELLRYSVLRGALQIADQRASAFEEAGEQPKYQSFAYKWNEEWTLRPVQKKVLERWEDSLLLLKATTGSGKTDAALLWAQKQIEAGKADNLIIALPTRFTSNALSIKATEQMSRSGLYHSSAWNHRYFERVEVGELTRREANAEHRYSRLLLAPTTVCTIDHLLISLTLLREDHHQIIAQLCNACVVIDEADFYDAFVQANLLHLLRLLRHWQVPVLLMSASLPDSAVELYSQSGFTIDGIADANTDKENNRKRFQLETFTDYESIHELAAIVRGIYSNEAVIIYVNTVQKAIALYQALQNTVDCPIAVYHSSFTETDKQAKEKEILALLGEEAWGKGIPNAIVILTQIGEMSINISATCMVSDLCPMDRLVQRVGRLQRFSDVVFGRLWLMRPLKDGKLYPTPYGDYDKKEKAWTPTKPIMKTEELLLNKAGQTFTNGELDCLNNQVYDKLEAFDEKAERNAKQLPEFLEYNLFIRADNNLKEDDENSAEWCSRNIEPRTTIFISDLQNEFPERGKRYASYRRYQNWRMKFGLEVRYSDFYRLLNNKTEAKESDPKIIEYTLVIGDDEKTIYILKEGLYNSKIGLNLNAKEEISF